MIHRMLFLSNFTARFQLSKLFFLPPNREKCTQNFSFGAKVFTFPRFCFKKSKEPKFDDMTDTVENGKQKMSKKFQSFPQDIRNKKYHLKYLVCVTGGKYYGFFSLYTRLPSISNTTLPVIWNYKTHIYKHQFIYAIY